MVNQPQNAMLQALKPNYSFSESPGCWWQTFKNYHVVDLEMSQRISDPFLFFKRTGNKLVGLVGTLVDDTIACENVEFSDLELRKSAIFDVKPRVSQLLFCFGGVTMRKFGKGLKIDQEAHAESLCVLNTKKFTAKEFAHLREQVAYVANTRRPDAAYIIAKLAQKKSTEGGKEEASLLNSVVSILKNRKPGFVFPKLDPESI